MAQEFVAGMTAAEAGLSQPEGPSLQEAANEKSARSFERTAAHLSNRRGEVVVGDSGNPLEAELQQVQAQIARGGFANFLEEDALHSRAQALATAIVRGEKVVPQSQQSASRRQAEPAATSADKDLFEDTPADISEDLNEHLRNEMPNINESLQFAADNMSDTAAQEINRSLASGDEGETVIAAQLVSQYHQHSEAFGHSEEVMAESSYYEAKEQFGEELANDVLRLSKGMAKGEMTLSDAIRACAAKPALLSALLDGQKNGLWTLNLGR